MARSRFFDQMQSYAFHLADVTPSLAPPFYTLGMGTPVSFASCSMPEITLEIESFRQLNSMYQSHVISGASVGAISFSRGVLTVDSTFYRWINRSITGSDRVHRDLCLLHASSLAPLHNLGEDYKEYDGRTPARNSVKTGADAGAYGMFRVLGKGYILHNCLPTRYKAGTDLDATSSEVSVAELEVQPEYITEFSLDPLQLTDI
jgi:hypothetical protein